MDFLAKCKDDGLISARAHDKLVFFTDLILQWNPRINLTGFNSRNEIEEILLGECILALRALQLSGRSVLDFGSGAGIPGLVWLIVEPSISLTSLEIRTKRVAFQKEAVRKLDLKAEIVCGSFPEAIPGRQFDVIVTRAVRFDQKLWGRSLHHLDADGIFVRFAKVTEASDDWRSIVLTERSSILLKHVPRGTSNN